MSNHGELKPLHPSEIWGNYAPAPIYLMNWESPDPALRFLRIPRALLPRVALCFFRGCDGQRMHSPHRFPLEFHAFQALCEVNIAAEDLWGCRLDASHRAQPAFYHLRSSASTLGLSGALSTFLSSLWAGPSFTLRSQLPGRLIVEFPQQRWVSFLREMITHTSG